MNRHEGVSCDSCLKGNFSGPRYKCLVCYNFDLCSGCYGNSSAYGRSRHNANHPVQCILTRADCELYYGGETPATMQQPQAYTCPYCSRMGFTIATLREHIAAIHAESTSDVVCPVCAAMPGGDPNHILNDLSRHLTLEHHAGLRDLILVLDEPTRTQVHNARQIPNLGHSGHAATERGSQLGRPRRSSIHYSTSALSALSPSSWDLVDPVAELLSQLSTMRRSSTNTSAGANTQARRLQVQLMAERQRMITIRQQAERLPRRQTQSHTAVRETSNAGAAGSRAVKPKSSEEMAQNSAGSLPASSSSSNFLLAGLLEEFSEQNVTAEVRSDRSQFVQQLVWSTVLQRKKN